MDRTVPAVIVVVVLLGVLLLMARSWRKRSARDSTLAAGYEFPPAGEADAASVVTAAPVFYVATTPRNVPLERLAIRGLGFRARGVLMVRTDGVVLELNGEQPVFLPSAALELLAKATFAIDRGVETDGLTVLGWRLAGSSPTAASHTVSSPTPTSPTPSTTSVDSYFRIVDQADRARVIDAIRSIAPGVIDPTGTTESEA